MPNPFMHIELSTDDTGAARKFYKSVFDWKFQDAGNDYTMIDVGAGKNGAGGGLTKKMMPDVPTAWLPYVEVVDVKRTLAKVEKAGGKVVVPFMTIGDWGAIGVLIDPTGASLGIWQQAKKSAKKSAKAAAKKAPAKKTPAKKAPAKKSKGK